MAPDNRLYVRVVSAIERPGKLDSGWVGVGQVGLVVLVDQHFLLVGEFQLNPALFGGRDHRILLG